MVGEGYQGTCFRVRSGQSAGILAWERSAGRRPCSVAGFAGGGEEGACRSQPFTEQVSSPLWVSWRSVLPWSLLWAQPCVPSPREDRKRWPRLVQAPFKVRKHPGGCDEEAGRLWGLEPSARKRWGPSDGDNWTLEGRRERVILVALGKGRSARCS